MKSVIREINTLKKMVAHKRYWLLQFLLFCESIDRNSFSIFTSLSFVDLDAKTLIKCASLKFAFFMIIHLNRYNSMIFRK